MWKNKHLLCPCCLKKIMPLSPPDIVYASVYCKACKKQYRIVFESGNLKKMTREERTP